MMQQVADLHVGTPKTATKTNPVPRRTPPPPPPSAGETNRNSPQSHNPGMHGANDTLGAFWNTEHAKNVVPDVKTRPRKLPNAYSSNLPISKRDRRAKSFATNMRILRNRSRRRKGNQHQNRREVKIR
ncbi:unnamed protein product [Cuscuta campestris]|uniref:Uncharacterized protein n=1 Tax=Cuscuta campestris TaxID=132261 RepID=A0A484KC61_9ASTE|nr:unnamed protein product [Cuscuta campestris]